MNTPTPAPVLNPVSASWKQALASVQPLANLYAVGFALMVALGFAMSRVSKSFSFVFGLDSSVLVWIPVILALGLLMGWYTIHLLLTLSRHRAHQPLPAPMDSLRRIPQLLLGGIMSIVIITGPFLILLLVSLGLSMTAGAQEVGSIASEIANSGSATDLITLESGAEAATGSRLLNLFQGGFGILAILAGGFWAIYSSLRLSQVSPLIVLENSQAMEAIKRSWAMTKGQLWYILGWGIVLGLFSFLLGIPAGIVDGLFGFISVTLGMLAIASNALNAFIVSPWASFFTIEIFERVKQNAAHQATSTSSTQS